MLKGSKWSWLVVPSGLLAASCGKIGYDAPAIPAAEASAGFDSAPPPPPDAQQDRSAARDAPNDSPGNVLTDVTDGKEPSAAFAVGSFIKIATPTAQTVPLGLGQSPKALLLWTVGKTGAGPSADYMYAFGVSDGPGSSRSLANASKSGATPSNATRRSANRAISIVQWGEVTVAEADLVSWDASSFTLSWPTNNADPYIVHYVAIGGAGVSAKVVSWQAPIMPGVKSVGGVGFRPDTVLNFYSGALFVNPVPWNQVNGSLGMGMLDGAGNQCAFQVAVVDGANPTITAHGMRTDASVYMFSERPGPMVMKQASLVSMDASGFTLDFTTAETSPTQMFSLALGGVAARVGAFDKASSAPLVQPVTGVGFEPGLVFLASVEDTAQAVGVSQPHVNLSTGASNGRDQANVAIHDVDNVTASAATGLEDPTGVFDLPSTVSKTGGARAAMASLDADGFSLRWTANDPSPARICYWALGPR